MKLSALILALLAAPVGAQAADLSYSWLEADYIRLKPDNFESTDGIGIRGSGALGDNFNVIVGWSKIDGSQAENLPNQLPDTKAWYAGFGYHTPVSESADLFAEVAYNKETTFDNDGVSGRVGVRAAFGPNFEGGAALAYTKFDHIDANTAIDVFGQYKFTPMFGISAEAVVGNNDKSVVIGPRVSF